MARANGPDLIILDRMLPELEGLAVLEAVRAAGLETPVILLSALSTIDEKVKGLRAGGDDYLTKPFAFSELLARLEALLRRRSHQENIVTRLTCHDLELDLLTHKVKRGGEAIELLPREFRLLEFLLRHQGQLVTRSMLLEGVWEYYFDPQTNVIDVHISRLRQKIDKGHSPPLIHTMRGTGYILKAGD
jgi:two-component system OmpR family response regulator